MSRIHRSVILPRAFFCSLIVCGPTLRAQRLDGGRGHLCLRAVGPAGARFTLTVDQNGRGNTGRPGRAGGSQRFGAACDRGF